MFERFTDRARKVLALANQEAQRLNHEYVGSEHILLGLVKEGTGVAHAVLANLRVDLSKIRGEVEKLVRSTSKMVLVAKLPQSPHAKKVVEYATEEARNFNHNYVGTEHLLLGLLRDVDGVGCQVLRNLGVDIENTRKATLELLGKHAEDAAQNTGWQMKSGTINIGEDVTVDWKTAIPKKVAEQILHPNVTVPLLMSNGYTFTAIPKIQYVTQSKGTFETEGYIVYKVARVDSQYEENEEDNESINPFEDAEYNFEPVLSYLGELDWALDQAVRELGLI